MISSNQTQFNYVFSYMKKNYLYLLVFSVSLFFSCEKGEDADATSLCPNYVHPSNYFPAYPGTWWTYDTPYDSTYTLQIASKPKKLGDQCYPYMNEIAAAVNDNSIYHSVYTGMGSSHYEKSPIYSTALGYENWCVASFVNMSKLTTLAGPEEFKFRRVLIEQDAEIYTLNGGHYTEVLVMKEYNIDDTTRLYYDYFAPNVGLVKRDFVNYLDTTDRTEILTLKEYNITN